MPSSLKKDVRGTVLCLVSPHFGILDSWLPVLARLRERDPDIQLVALLPAKSWSGQINPGDFITELAEQTFDLVVFRHPGGGWLKAPSLKDSIKVADAKQDCEGQEFGELLTNIDAILFDVTEQRRTIVSKLQERFPDAHWFSLPHGIDPRFEDKTAARKPVECPQKVKAYATGPAEISFYNKAFGLRDSQIEVVGTPRHAAEWINSADGERTASSDERPYIFLAARPANEAFFPQERKIAALQDIKRLCAELDLNLIIRPHPKQRAQSEKIIDEVFRDAQDELQWRTSNEHPFALGRNALFAITFLSSVAIDMTAIGTPVVEYVDFSEIDPLPPLIKGRNGQATSIYQQLGLALGARSYKELLTHALDIQRDRRGVVAGLRNAYDQCFMTIEDPISSIARDIEGAVQSNLSNLSQD